MNKEFLLSFGEGWVDTHESQMIATVVVIILFIVIKVVSRKLAGRYGRRNNKSEARVLQARKVISVLINTIFLIVLAVIWGVRGENLMVGMAAVFTFFGVALFAQWSIISNVTAGIIIYFSAPFRLGDKITIIDKDIPIHARIEDIKTFYTYIRTDNDELIVIPNSLFLQKIVAVKE